MVIFYSLFRFFKNVTSGSVRIVKEQTCILYTLFVLQLSNLINGIVMQVFMDADNFSFQTCERAYTYLTISFNFEVFLLLAYLSFYLRSVKDPS